MRSFRVFTTAFACVVMALATACAGATAPAQPAPTVFQALPVTGSTATHAATVVAAAKAVPPATATVAATETTVPTATTEPTATAGAEDIVFDTFTPANFDHSNIIDNPWLPLKPGTRFVYDGMSVNDSGELQPHRIVVNVTDLTKMLGSVRVLVTWDQDISNGVVAESELAFYAQDKGGNVWYVGEYPEAYENGKLVDAPTWIDGLKGAKAGIMMQANPQTGTPSYAEGWGPEVGWSDVGQVDQLGQQKVCVKMGCYNDILVVAETSGGEGNAQQLKFYARNVGNIRVSWRGSQEKTKETLELTSIEQLSADAMAEVRLGALKLEQSAYEHSKDVYGLTKPLEPNPNP